MPTTQTGKRQETNAKKNKGKLYHQLSNCPRCGSAGSLVYRGDHVNCDVCERTYSKAYLHSLAEKAKVKK